MCGIAGYSLGPDSGVGRTLVAQALLAGIAERGADAVGYAVAAREGAVTVVKRRAGASALLDELTVPQFARHVLLHVRDFTKGGPEVETNNHPIRHGPVVGIHNGVIENDDELFGRHGIRRHDPETTVDSEIIFALVARDRRRKTTALEQLRGSLAAAWIDERDLRVLSLARGVERPLWIAAGANELLFASTCDALQVAAEYAGVRVRMREVPEGSLLSVADGRIVRRERFRPDRAVAPSTVTAEKAPEERRACLARLALIAAAA